MPTFDFGTNWEDYSYKRLDVDRLDIAVRSLGELVGRSSLEGCSVLDIGCGSGLFSIAASKMGAEKVVGIDINPLCIEVSERNRDRYHPALILFKNISVLDQQGMDSLGKFDLVYAWGSLHHTGAMWEAIKAAAERVTETGIFVLAIYNHHFTSPVWQIIKNFYNQLPDFGRTIMAVLFTPAIFTAKLLVTGQNPLNKERGMDFWFDVIDWIGGFPYEYASPENVDAYVRQLGFRKIRFKAALVPTGCNEFVFVKTNGNSRP